jgi:hypothetical protein
LILFTGRGTSGSWQIRGEQLGSRIGTVKPKATLDDIKAADLVVVVKRVNDELLDSLRKSGKPWIFDAVDFYPQPASSSWSKSQAVAWVRGQLNKYQPDAVIWPNMAMMSDCGGQFRECVLYHHYKPAIAINPIRPEVKTVGYEGSLRYIGGYMKTILKECELRGWDFTTNPAHLAELDIVLAVRDKPGYASHNWKSNVKLANAHGTGTPFIGPMESGYLETASGAEEWIKDHGELSGAFDRLSCYETRKAIKDKFLKAAIPVEKTVERLKAFLAV